MNLLCRYTLAGLALGGAACSPRLELSVSRADLPANGHATREIVARGGRPPVRFEVLAGRELVELFPAASSCRVRAGLTPGPVRVRASDARATTAEIDLALFADENDADRDGFPDVAELASDDDRALFRARLVAVARSQRSGYEPAWEVTQRDCAGLARFAYRQAWRAAPTAWVQSHAHEHGLNSWGKLRLAYPALPLIGERLFRRQPGVFRAEASDFASFADAKHLLLFNTECVGREERLAQTGDLLFFFHADNARAPYHMMIYFREAGRGRLVYHTGVTEGEAGMMKEISVERLFRHPDPTWHPRGDNEHFLGFYRFKILA